MYTVTLEKECACFKRSSFKATQSFETKEEASVMAQKMAKEMTHEFCKEHGFAVIEEEDNFLIILMS